MAQKQTTSPGARDLAHPVFAQPQPTADPSSFRVHHASDGAAYKEIDALNKQHKLSALPFPAPRTDGTSAEPRLTLEEVMGSANAAKIAQCVIECAGVT